MATIMGFSIKGLKEEKGNYKCSLYYNNKKVGKITKDNDPYIEYNKYGETLKNTIYEKVEEYFQKYTRYIDEKYDTYELALFELVSDLIELTKIEKRYIKVNEKNKALIIKFLYYDKNIYNEKKTEYVVSCIIDNGLWTETHTKLFIDMYKPMSYIIYDSLESFNIN